MPFRGKDNLKIVIIDDFQKSSSPEPLGQFQPSTKPPWVKGIQIKPQRFLRGDNLEAVKIN